jgi:arginyl-tRNA synthetase
MLDTNAKLLPPISESETNVYLTLLKFNEMMENAFEEKAPHKVCQFIYEVSEAFNRFYHENKILAEEDDERKSSYLNLLALVKRTLETCIDVIGLESPDRM